MGSDEIRSVISRFSGNIEAAYNVTKELYYDFNFNLDMNFESTNSLQRFTNVVRNMMSRGLIEKPKKSGRSLIFDERSFLQLIVARKYLAAGCSMNSLSGYLNEMPTEDLYDRLFIKQLPDIEEVAGRNFYISFDRAEHQKNLFREEKMLVKDNELFRHIKINTGFYLHVREHMFSRDELFAITKLLEEYMRNR